jgi:hypothetical protein
LGRSGSSKVLNLQRGKNVLKMKNRIAIMVLAAGAGVGLGGGALRADTITAFNFNGNTGSETSVAASTQAPGTTSSDISRGGGLGGPSFSSGGSFAFKPIDHYYNDSQADKEAKGEYVLFSVTPEAGHTLSLSQIVFGVNMQSGTANEFPELSVSSDGTNFTVVAASSTTGPGSNAYSSVNVGTFDLSGLANLQNTSSTITFHLFDSTPTSDGHGYQTGSIVALGRQTQNDALTLSGAVGGGAVPEPASLGLLALGGLVMLRRRTL